MVLTQLSTWLFVPCHLQSSSQGQLLAQQQARLGDLEGSVRQWEERCADLRDLVAGHEGRCKEAAAEVMKGNEVIEKLQVRGGGRVGMKHLVQSVCALTAFDHRKRL
jgi:hypothetical protein